MTEPGAIVVTGIGLVTPLACGREPTWAKVKEGVPINRQDAPNNFVPELSSFVRNAPLKNLNGLPKIFPMSVWAVQEAIQDSGLVLASLPSDRIGCSVSVSKPILSETLRLNFSEKNLPDCVGQHLAREFKISGPVQNIVAACATGLYSMQLACYWLRKGDCDAVIAGSVESSVHPLYVSGFDRMGVLADVPCPFDQRRKGFVIGEGAGILILERKRDAIARKAKIYSQVLACAVGSDTSRPTAFDSEGQSIATVLRRALEQSDCSSGDIHYINLHGTGTLLNDLLETKAIRKIFGKNADAISYSSTKSSTGHLLGAAGSVEAGLTCLAIRDQFVAPTANLECPDPACDLDYTPLRGKPRALNTALSLSFGFGGSIGAVVFSGA